MAVVRWLADEPRPHLKDTCFVVHSHNANAACMMSLHLEAIGYRVRTQPFGSDRRPSRPLVRIATAFLRLLRGPGGHR